MPTPESQTSPAVEARALLATMLRNGESANEVRELIIGDGSGPALDPATLKYRQAILLEFEIRLSKHQHGNSLPPVLREAIVRLLRQGLSHKAIRERIPVGLPIINKLSVEIGAAFTKTHGRGRRFTPEMWEKIRAAVATGRPSAEIEREFEIDEHSVRKARRELGDFVNRRYLKKLTDARIEEAANKISGGMRWRDAAADLNVSPTTLLRWCKYRKRASWRYFAPKEKRVVLAGIERGWGKRHIAQTLGRPRSSVALVMNQLRAKYPELPQRAGMLPKQRAAILAARAQGESFAAVGRQFGLTAGGVFRIVKGGKVHGRD